MAGVKIVQKCRNVECYVVQSFIRKVLDGVYSCKSGVDLLSTEHCWRWSGGEG